MVEGVTEKDRTDFSTAERKPEMPRGAGVNGVHGEPAGFIRSARKSFEIECHKNERAAKSRNSPWQVKKGRPSQGPANEKRRRALERSRAGVVKRTSGL